MRGKPFNGRRTGQRQLRRLSRIAAHWRAEQSGNALLVILRLGPQRPVADAIVDLVRGNILRHHRARLAPAAIQCIGVGQVLTKLRCVIPGTQGIGKQRDAAGAVAGQSQGQAHVAHRNAVALLLEDCQGFTIMASTNLGERQAECGSRAVVTEPDAIVECGGGGIEAAIGKIGKAQLGAQRRTLRVFDNGFFGAGDITLAVTLRLCDFPGRRRIGTRQMNAASAAGQDKGRNCASSGETQGFGT